MLLRQRKARRLKWLFTGLTTALFLVTGASFCRTLNVEVLGEHQLEFGIGGGRLYLADISNTLLYGEIREAFSIQVGHDWWGFRPYPAKYFLDVCMIYPFLFAAAFGMWFTRLSRKRPKDACLACGYDLTGNTSGTCPECGRIEQT